MKTSLKKTMNSSCLKLYHAYSISFNSSNVGRFSWSWILKDWNKLQEKTEVVVLCSRLSSTKREIGHFHVVVMQRQQRGAQKSAIHLQSCCFAYINLLLSAVLVAVARRLCLSSLKMRGEGGHPLWDPCKLLYVANLPHVTKKLRWDFKPPGTSRC